jgi:hypothetical protein
LKKKKENKITTPFTHTPGIVVNKKGSMITVKHGDKLITRDVSHFKPIWKPPPMAQQPQVQTSPPEPVSQQPPKPPDQPQHIHQRPKRTINKPLRYR